MAQHPRQIEQYRPIVSKFFAPEDVDQALMLMWYESRGRTDAANSRSSGRGLFQLDEAGWSDRAKAARKYYAGKNLAIGADIYDAETNIAVAARTLAERGWGAWSSGMRGRPAAPGQYGPTTYWSGTTYANRGGGPVDSTLRDIPDGGHPSSPAGIDAPTGTTATEPTYSSRQAAMELLGLLSDQIAGGSRARIEEMDGGEGEGLFPDVSTPPGEDTSEPGPSAPRQAATAPTGQTIPPIRDTRPNLFTHPLASGVQPNGIGLYGEPRDHGPHEGIDLGAPAGTPFITMAPGVVKRAEESKGLGGQVVEIDHGNGVVSSYFHVQDFMVEAGDQVAAGQHIATVGMTGNADSPHIHLEVREGGRPVDPSTVIGQYQYGES